VLLIDSELLDEDQGGTAGDGGEAGEIAEIITRKACKPASIAENAKAAY